MKITSKDWFDILYLFVVALIESIFAVTFSTLYWMIVMLVFGEQEDSFLYREANNYIVYGMILFIPMAFNLVMAWRYYRKKNLLRATGLFIITAIYLLVMLSYAIQLSL